MAQAEKDIALDPAAILLGVTQRDFAVNYRTDGRRGVVLLARLSPRTEPSDVSRVWLESRLRKILTKNILLLAFHLPQSQDPTSVLYFTMNQGRELDMMSESIVGGSGRWMSTNGDATVTVAAAAGRPESWGTYSVLKPPEDTSSEVFETDMSVGLFIQRRTDFYLEGSPPLQFVRVFRTKDNATRAFGVGANDSLDIFLVGQMGVWTDVVDEAGTRVHFQKNVRRVGSLLTFESEEGSSIFFNPRLEFDSNTWHLRTSDGWDYVFPYRPNWPGTKVTVLNGYSDAYGRPYAMMRDAAGNLLSLTTPSGYSLTFRCDSAGRFRKISDSRDRTVEYTYDQMGRLVRFVDSSGNEETYTYDGANHMLLVLDGAGRRILKNDYEGDDVVEQTLADGRQLKFRYTRRPDNTLTQSIFTDPKGFTTTFNFSQDDLWESLPQASAP